MVSFVLKLYVAITHFATSADENEISLAFAGRGLEVVGSSAKIRAKAWNLNLPFTVCMMPSKLH